MYRNAIETKSHKAIYSKCQFSYSCTVDVLISNKLDVIVQLEGSL